ncbi:MAG: ATP-binding cassette domain-containing protein [Oligoflexia bacterium]|nr:ATP-binding cassette domain-containing protein [Oligoflexia bacterium]
MLQVKGVSRSFGPKQILKDVTFSLEPGTITGLIGPSGGGKSVLLKIMGGVMRADSGEVCFDECVANEDGSLACGLMFQEGALFDSISVLDNVAFPLVSGKVPVSLLGLKRRRAVTERVAAILARVGLARAWHKMPGQLSGGMRRRTSLARALVSHPPVVLLDDPTAGLDPVASSVIMNLIVELHHEYRPTMLVVSHDLRRLLPVVDSIYALYDGSIQFGGNLAKLRAEASPFLRSFVTCRFELGQGSSHPAPH